MTKFDTLFLDRDGILNRKIDDSYVLKIGDIKIMPGIKEFLFWASKIFKKVIVVTNQRCVGRKLLNPDALVHINQTINEMTGYKIAAFFSCPHLSEVNCACRKPKEGLFLKAADHFTIDFQRSWMIGDSESDLIPAKKLGMQTMFVSETESDFADITVKSTSTLLESFIAATQPIRSTYNYY